MFFLTLLSVLIFFTVKSPTWLALLISHGLCSLHGNKNQWILLWSIISCRHHLREVSIPYSFPRYGEYVSQSITIASNVMFVQHCARAWGLQESGKCDLTNCVCHFSLCGAILRAIVGKNGTFHSGSRGQRFGSEVYSTALGYGKAARCDVGKLFNLGQSGRACRDLGMWHAFQRLTLLFPPAGCHLLQLRIHLWIDLLPRVALLNSATN